MKDKKIINLSPDEVRFRSLLFRMEKESISRNQAVKIVGGEKRLQRLMSEGTIRYEKPEGSANRQWLINAADCYRCVKPHVLSARGRAQMAI